MNNKRNISYMSDTEIIDFIKGYVEKSSYNYAVLINGSWGSGKTFFVKNDLIPSLREYEKSKFSKKRKHKKRKVIYISIYCVRLKEFRDKGQV